MDILITIGITIGVLLIIPTILGILYLLTCIYYDTKYGEIILKIIVICLFILILFYNVHYALVEVNIIKPFLPI